MSGSQAPDFQKARPNDTNVGGLMPEAASEILTPMKNLVPKAERTKWD